MQIDLTSEVLRQRTKAPHDKYRRRIITTAALLTSLAVSGFLGVMLGERNAGDGQVTFAGADLAVTSQGVALDWTLANFNAMPAEVKSVMVDGKPAALDSTKVEGESITEFTTPVQCGAPNPPQFVVVIADGAGDTQELGYLVSMIDWVKLCSGPRQSRSGDAE